MNNIFLDNSVPINYFRPLQKTTINNSPIYKGNKQYHLLGQIEVTYTTKHRIYLIAKIIFSAGLIFILDENFKTTYEDFWKNKKVFTLYSSNLASIFSFYKNKSKNNNLIAKCNLGYMYENGIGVHQSWIKTAIYYTSIMRTSNAEKQYLLGCVCIKENLPEQAIRLCKLAAEKGNIDAQCMLGCSYVNGKGVEQSLEEAIKWYTLAAENGDMKAKYKLKNIYASEEGLKGYTLALEKGYVNTQCNLKY